MKVMKFPGINIEEELLKTRQRHISEETVLKEVQNIFDVHKKQEEAIRRSLDNGNSAGGNDFLVDLLHSERIFHVSDIRKICIDYRLRFLDSKYFKDEIPYPALLKVKSLEKEHQTVLEGFKIIAPSISFKLKNADDPLLFAPIGNNYFYLIHKWGNDLHPFRKLLMWPFKTLENFAILLLIGSFGLTLMVPDGMFSPQQNTTEFLIIFFFIFKWVSGLAIFYGVKKGKNFSSSIWNSKYYNA